MPNNNPYFQLSTEASVANLDNQHNSKKTKSIWQAAKKWLPTFIKERLFTANTGLKVFAIGILLFGGAGIAYGVGASLWAISIPLALLVAGASTLIWFVSVREAVYNRFAKWGTELDLADAPLNDAEKLVDEMKTLSAKLQREIDLLNQAEQKHGHFGRLLKQLRQIKPTLAVEMADLYVRALEQHNQKHEKFLGLMKKAQLIDAKNDSNLARDIENLYYSEAPLNSTNPLIKSKLTYQDIEKVDTKLSNELKSLCSRYQAKEVKLNSEFSLLLNKIKPQSKELAQQFSSLYQAPGMSLEHNTPHLFKAYSCKVRQKHLYGLLETMNNKRNAAANLMQTVVVHDATNQARETSIKGKLAVYSDYINNGYFYHNKLSKAYYKIIDKINFLAQTLLLSLTQSAANHPSSTTTAAVTNMSQAAANQLPIPAQTLVKPILTTVAKPADTTAKLPVYANAHLVAAHLPLFAAPKQLEQEVMTQRYQQYQSHLMPS